MATLKTKRGSEIKPGDYIGYTAGFALELRRVTATYETETYIDLKTEQGIMSVKPDAVLLVVED